MAFVQNAVQYYHKANRLSSYESNVVHVKARAPLYKSCQYQRHTDNHNLRIAHHREPTLSISPLSSSCEGNLYTHSPSGTSSSFRCVQSAHGYHPATLHARRATNHTQDLPHYMNTQEMGYNPDNYRHRCMLPNKLYSYLFKLQNNYSLSLFHPLQFFLHTTK